MIAYLFWHCAYPTTTAQQYEEALMRFQQRIRRKSPTSCAGPRPMLRAGLTTRRHYSVSNDTDPLCRWVKAIAAVVFDLDGVLIDSESVWDAARREVVARNSGRWQADATRAMMGMSSPEWSRYLHDELGVPLEPEQNSWSPRCSINTDAACRCCRGRSRRSNGSLTAGRLDWRHRRTGP